MLTRTLLILVLASCLSGCAGELELQRVAGQSGTILSAYRSSVRDFAVGQNALNAANESRIVQLGRMRAIRRAEVDARVANWRLGGDTPSLRRFEVIGETTAEQVLANAGPAPEPATIPALANDSGEVDAIIKQLVDLQKPVTAAQRLDDVLAYGDALRDAYRKAIDDAKADAEKAGSAAAEAEDAVAKPPE